MRRVQDNPAKNLSVQTVSLQHCFHTYIMLVPQYQAVQLYYANDCPPDLVLFLPNFVLSLNCKKIVQICMCKS